MGFTKLTKRHFTNIQDPKFYPIYVYKIFFLVVTWAFHHFMPVWNFIFCAVFVLPRFFVPLFLFEIIFFVLPRWPCFKFYLLRSFSSGKVATGENFICCPFCLKFYLLPLFLLPRWRWANNKSVVLSIMSLFVAILVICDPAFYLWSDLVTGVLDLTRWLAAATMLTFWA